LQVGSGTPVLSIAAGTSNTGEFLWTIPESIVAGQNYLIRISRNDGSNITGVSDAPFTISPPVSTYYVNDANRTDRRLDEKVLATTPNDGLTPATPKASIQALIAGLSF